MPVGMQRLSEATTPNALHRPVVLLVDDSAFVRASLAKRLSAQFVVRQASSGEHAWETLLLDPDIAAVLSDLSMPGIDGFQLLGRVRNSVVPRIRRLPVAVLSGADDAAARRRAIELGADRFEVKAENVDPLCVWLAQAIGKQSPEAVDPRGSDLPPVSRLGQPDKSGLQDWLMSVFGRLRPTVEAPAVLYRLHAVGIDDVPGRLRRGIRAADALHLDESGTAWLCAAGTASHALRLALRFGVLAAGREAASGASGARVEVCVHPIDPLQPLACLNHLQDREAALPLSAGLAIRSAAGGWGLAWDCQLPWPAARLLVSG